MQRPRRVEQRVRQQQARRSPPQERQAWHLPPQEQRRVSRLRHWPVSPARLAHSLMY
jgi:hypothetical protein